MADSSPIDDETQAETLSRWCLNHEFGLYLSLCVGSALTAGYLADIGLGPMDMYLVGLFNAFGISLAAMKLIRRKKRRRGEVSG